MKQENKELLLKDICARSPYGVKARVYNHWSDDVQDETITIENLHQLIKTFSIEDIKPYLFPLSSMSDEMWNKEFMGCGITEFTRDSFKYGCETLAFNNCNPNLSSTVRFINKLIKNHFDIYGLIPKGLAIDATGKNIY